MEAIAHDLQAKPSAYTFHVTKLIQDEKKMLKVCTDRGIIFFPEQIKKAAVDA